VEYRRKMKVNRGLIENSKRIRNGIKDDDGSLNIHV
jgi:hypothetical protein